MQKDPVTGQAQKDPATGKPVYVNSATGETINERPAPPPAGWVVKSDPTTHGVRCKRAQGPAHRGADRDLAS